MEALKRQQRKQIPSPPDIQAADADQQPAMLPVPQIPKETGLAREIPPPVTTHLHLSLAELKGQVDGLRERLERGRELVAEEEAELAAHADAITQLEIKLPKTGGLNRLNVEIELANAREKWKLLEATLVGQRRNLQQQEATYEQYYQALQQRQNSSEAVPADPTRPEPPGKAQTKNSVDKPQRQWRRWTLVLAAVGLLTTGTTAFYTWKSSSRQPSVSSIATEIPKSTGVSAIGYLEPAGEAIALSAPTTLEGARVQQLLVKLGDRVEVGQAIAILDSQDRLQAALEQAQAQARVARVRLEQVKAGAKTGDIQAQDAKLQRARAELAGQVAAQKDAIASLEAEFQGEKSVQEAVIGRIAAELHNAETDCRRYRQLYQDGAVSIQERDRLCLVQETTETRLREARANLQRIVGSWQKRIAEAKANLNRTVSTLQRQLAEEQASLNSVGEVRPVDVQVAWAELQSAEAAVQKARTDLEMAYVRAPKKGQILKIYSRPGEVVGDRGIAILGQTDRMYVKAEVYETDIRQVRTGQQAKIESDGIVGHLVGTVEEIGLEIGKQTILNTDPASDVDARVVEVRILLSPQDSQRVAGLTNLQVNVIVDTSPPKN